MANHGGSYELRDGKRVLKARTKPSASPTPEAASAPEPKPSSAPLHHTPTPPTAVDKPSKLKEPKHG